MAGRLVVFSAYVAVLAFLAGLYSIIRVTPAAAALPILSVKANPKIAFAPHKIDVVVIAKPDERNRALALALSSMDSAHTASTVRQVDGADARGELLTLTYPNVPAGTYVVVATLFDRNGKPIAQRDQEVRRLGRDRSPTESPTGAADFSPTAAAARSHGIAWILLAERSGEPRRNRTFNPQIKSLLLCQLS
jgi:hypothetical protein